MGRDKLKRKLQFKPKYTTFGSLDCKSEDTIYILHEELEAIYLMDNQGLYQEEASAKMQISRTTFARILKDARKKVSMMLIGGANLVIKDEKNNYTVMLTSSTKEQISIDGVLAEYLILYDIEEGQIINKKIIKNPIHFGKKKPAELLPSLCNEYGVNFFVSTRIGVGLKSGLLTKGVYAISKKTCKEDDLVTIHML